MGITGEGRVRGGLGERVGKLKLRVSVGKNTEEWCS